MHVTWTDPADIGAGNVRVYDNRGNVDRPYPDYSAPVDTVAAGVQSWDSGPLCDGLWVIGFRVYNGTYEEPNTSVLIRVRVVNGLIVAAPPPKPFLQAAVTAAGKVALRAFVLPNDNAGTPATVQFFTNNGAGGPVNYDTPITGGPITLAQIGQFYAGVLLSPVYGATARKFGSIAYNANGQASLVSAEVTATPDPTMPPQPLSVAVATGRV